jgi:ABC-type multidrug transport system fused ATPase/permease subunit
VDFTYPGSDRPALSDVSVSVPPGAVLAVVGASGSGKSTLGRIALRDLDPDDGAVLLGGIDARALDLAALRAATSRVDQDAALLSGTIRENVLPGGGPDDAERFEWAVRAARVDEFARRLPSGLDSDVGESGARLSGGQRQRIAFARALATGASLLVLDEATSALDAENESLISEALARLRGQVTMVVIAHRLSTVRHADLVLVLVGGRVVEFGGPDELLAAGGWWAAMVEASRADLAGVEGR